MYSVKRIPGNPNKASDAFTKWEAGAFFVGPWLLFEVVS